MSKSEIVVVSKFHQDVYAACSRAHSVQLTWSARMVALLTAQYGAAKLVKKLVNGSEIEVPTGGPNFDQYSADQSALREIAVQRKLKDNQWPRKMYAKAVRSTYGALPVAMTAEAIQKRVQRASADAAKRQSAANPPAPTAGAPAGQTQDHGQNPAEIAESIAARVGVYPMMYACLRILESDESTKVQAVHMRKMVDKAYDLHIKAQPNHPANKAGNTSV